MATATKNKTAKTTTFTDYLAEKESAAVEKVDTARERLATEHEQLETREEAVGTSEEAVDDLESKARAGDPSVTGKALVEARGDHEIASLVLAGSQKRIKRLTDFLSKSNLDKQVAVIVKDALLVHMLPKATAYATFHAGGFAQDATKPETLPALVVSQLEGGIGNDGVGAGVVRIVWHRSPLHAPLDADRLRAALEAAGFTVDPSFSLNDGVTVSRDEGADRATVRLRNVADRTPVARAPLSSVDGWDDDLAREVAESVNHVEAQGVGAQIVSSEEDRGIRTTVVRLHIAAAANRFERESHDINLPWIFGDQIAKQIDQVRRGAGRCVEAKKVPAIDGKGAAFFDGKQVLAAELTFKAKTA